jgi:hypothetical protein
MSVSATGVVTFDDGRVYAGLPEGVKPFWGRVSITGNGSGGYLFGYLEFNPNSQETFQQYVQISTWSISTQIAGTGDGVMLGALENDWERASILGSGLVLGIIQPGTIGASIAEGHGTDGDIKMLGRVNKGTPGRIYIATENTNTKITSTVVTGLVSDFPIVGMDTVRV